METHDRQSISKGEFLLDLLEQSCAKHFKYNVNKKDIHANKVTLEFKVTVCCSSKMHTQAYANPHARIITPHTQTRTQTHAHMHTRMHAQANTSLSL